MHPRLLTEMIVIAALKRLSGVAQLSQFSEDRFSVGLYIIECHKACLAGATLKSLT